MNRKHGLSSILIILFTVIAGVVLLLTFYYVSNERRVGNNIPTLNTKEGQQTPKSLVLIIVDELTFRQLSSELDRLANDIKHDLEVDVKVEHTDYKEASEIRSLIKQSYLTEKRLIGSILVGNVPYAMVENVGGGYTGNIGYPSDAYYQDLDDELWTDFNHNGMLDAIGGLLTPSRHKEIWSGRIKPTELGANGVVQLREYLDRNHAYRTSTLPEKTKLLFYNAVYKDLVNPKNTVATFQNWLRNAMNNIAPYTSNDALHPFLTPENTAYVDITDGKTEKDEYISKLSNSSYDLVFTNVHGSHELIQPAPNSNIFTKDIKDIRPQGHFYIMASCGTARFSESSFYAGELLFNGRGLGVYGFTEPVGIATVLSILGVDFLQNYAPLRLGAIWGDIIKQDTTPITVFIGDPTLRLRNPQKGEIVSWEVSEPLVSQLKLGEGAASIFRIKNNGRTPLLLSNGGVPTSYASVNGKIFIDEYRKRTDPNIASNPNYTTDTPFVLDLLPSNSEIQSKGVFVPAPDGQILTGYRILQNETMDFIVDLSRTNTNPNITTAREEEVLRVFQTNDPRRPYIELRAKIKVLPPDHPIQIPTGERG